MNVKNVTSSSNTISETSALDDDFVGVEVRGIFVVAVLIVGNDVGGGVGGVGGGGEGVGALVFVPKSKTRVGDAQNLPENEYELRNPARKKKKEQKLVT